MGSTEQVENQQDPSKNFERADYHVQTLDSKLLGAGAEMEVKIKNAECIFNPDQIKPMSLS